MVTKRSCWRMTVARKAELGHELGALAGRIAAEEAPGLGRDGEQPRVERDDDVVEPPAERGDGRLDEVDLLRCHDASVDRAAAGVTGNDYSAVGGHHRRV